MGGPHPIQGEPWEQKLRCLWEGIVPQECNIEIFMGFPVCQVALQIKNLAASNHMSWLKCIYIYMYIHTRAYTHTHIYRASLVAQMVKESACTAEDPGSIPGSGRSSVEWLPTPVFLPGEFHGQSCWWATVLGSQTVGHDWATYTFTFTHIYMWKEMETHSSILAWRIPETEEPGGLQPWGCRESDMTERLAYMYTQR